MSDTTVLKGNAAGGLLDNLLNKGSLPSVNIKIEKETMVSLGIMIVISITIVVLIQHILKLILLK